MKRQRSAKKAAAVLGCAALLAAASLAAAPSYARYETNNDRSMVYAPQKAEVTADHLAAGGQTVLLSDWQMDSAAPRKETVTLKTQAGEAQGTIRCSTDRPDYLTAVLDAENCRVSPSGCPVQLTLTPTDAALALTQPQEVTVHVGWTAANTAQEALWAEYQVTLLPDGTQKDALPSGAAEQITLDAPESFAWTERLVLRAVMPAAADTLVLQMNGGSFPEGTRCTAQGKTVMLGDAMDLRLPVTANEAVSLVLDLTEVIPEEQVMLKATVLHGGTASGQGEAQVFADRENLSVELGSAEDMVICGSGLLQYPISNDTTGLSWKLMQLQRTDGGIAYMEEEDQFFLTVDVKEKTMDGQTEKVLSISNEAGMAPAGSYLLLLERTQNGQLLSELEVPFFIHYGAPGAN